MHLRSEFASVRVEIDNQANGPRLMIEDLKSGQKSFYDPLTLEALAWTDPQDLAELLQPGRRWKDKPVGSDGVLDRMLKDVEL